MHEFPARARRRDVQQFHRLRDRRVFVGIGDDEELRQLRCLLQKIQALARGLAGDQDQRSKHQSDYDNTGADVRLAGRTGFLPRLSCCYRG